MAVTGGTTDGWYLVQRDGAKEYREVSTDGTQENTKQQKRSHETLVRVSEHCHVAGSAQITAFNTDEGALAASPSFKVSWGQTFFAGGLWVVVSDSFEPGERGESKLVNVQVLKLFGNWEDA